MRDVSDSYFDLYVELIRELVLWSEVEIIVEFIIVFLIGLIGLCGNFFIILVIVKILFLRIILNYYIVLLSF